MNFAPPTPTPTPGPADAAVDSPSAAFSRRTVLRALAFGTAGLATGAVAATAAAAAGAAPASAASSSSGSGWGIVAKPAASGPSPTTPQFPVMPPPTTIPSFRDVIDDVVNMPFDDELVRRARRYGLDVLNVTWEDTGRSLGSSGGPNISDLTLQVREPLGRGNIATHLLPVLRYPNFSDTTADVNFDNLWIKIGNQDRRSTVTSVPLREVLANLRSYVSDPYAVIGSNDLTARRDTHALVSAQHVFLPLPKQGKAEFTPVIYNYQSSAQNPAVLVLLATREGTSMAVVENWSGDQSYQQWGQQLFFNDEGQQTTFTGERKSAVKDRVDSGRAKKGDAGALDSGSDMVMVIQVPLVHNNPPPPSYDDVEIQSDAAAAPAVAAPSASSSESKSAGVAQRRSDVEQAVIGHGEKLGPVREFAGNSLRRDDRFPIRVTVQFYRATSNGVVNESDLAEVKRDIDRVYANGDYVGSLVVPKTDHPRPTAWTRSRTPGWPYKS